MLRFVFACLLVLSFPPVSSLAQTELPSLDSDTPSGANAREAPRLDALAPELIEALRPGSLDFAIGSLDYRLVGRGVKAEFRIAGAAVGVLIGYRGEPRLELAEWRAYRGNVRLALVAQDGDGGYRIEFTRDF